MNFAKPSLAKSPGFIQAKLKIGQPNDQYEQEADKVADRIMNMSKTNNPSIQRKCADCEEDELQMKPLSSSQSPSAAISKSVASSKGSGQELDKPTQSLMSKGIGADFSTVKIHTDAKAIQMNRQLGAKAFTNGNDIYFNQGQYNPATAEGKQLLAHELVHTVQQGASSNKIQRKLSVEDDYPEAYVKGFQPDPKGEDPSRALSNTDRLDLVKTQLGKITPDFGVESSGEVKPTHSKSEQELADGDKATGACCLHVLTRNSSTNDWEIVVADHLSPHTNDRVFKVLINSNLNPVKFGYHNQAGKKLSYKSNPELILGHELCGHASLEEIGAHAEGRRAVTNVHDSTINIENAIAEDLGRKQDQLRGLAKDGPHKGESFGESVVIDFGFNKHNVNELDSKELDKLKLIADVVKVFDFFVELRGHSDNVGSEAAKQNISEKRAQNVAFFLAKQGVSEKAKVNVDEGPDIRVPRFLLKGLSDKEPLPGINPATEQHKLRRVDVIISSFPAGLSELPPGVTKSQKEKLKKFDQVKEPKKVKAILLGGTPCEKQLVKKAYR